MKSLILALLISLTAQADYVDQCDTVKKAALAVMIARQNNMSAATLLKITHDRPVRPNHVLNKILITDAYQEKVEVSQIQKNAAATLFAVKYYDKCWTGQV